MTALAGSPGLSEVSRELGVSVLLVVGSVLFSVGLAYRFWRWLQTPDEQTARKQEARRQQLKRTVRRPATDVPVHSGLEIPADTQDPALNDEGLFDE